ncbi:MAG: AzlC family ABC transporter permease [Ornithinimicrobium sp.]
MTKNSGSATMAGLRSALPLALAAIPFGLVYGVAVVDSSISPWVGLAGSWLILAGASQISLIELINSGAAWPVAVGTVLVINARHALYSAALAPAFAQFPKRWRFTLPYLLTDQAATLSINRFEEMRDPGQRRLFFTAAAVLIASLWWAGSVTGVLLGASIPEQVDVGFAVPAMFLALLVPSLTHRPAVVAAVVGAAVTVMAAPLPSGLNVTIGALAGIAAGAVVLTHPLPSSTGNAS